MKKRFNTLVFTLAACYCLSVLPMVFTGCANASGGGGSSGKEKKDDKKDGNKTGDNSTLPFTSTSLKRTGRTEIINDNEIEILQFGDWPQSEKDSSVTIDKSQKTTHGENTYYKGSDGAWYAEIAAAFANPSNPGEGYKYFKVEPIEWYVLSKDYSGKTLLLAKTILKKMEYHDSTAERIINEGYIKSNSYKYSEIRAYLNGTKYEKNTAMTEYTTRAESKHEGKGFLQTAFDSEDQALIETTTLDNTCDDKIFLLSPEEAKNTALGFQEYEYSNYNPTYGDPLINHTECAYSQLSDGLFTPVSSAYFNWWLREPAGTGSKSTVAGSYYYDDFDIEMWVGGAVDSSDTVTERNGIVPALCISTSTYENLSDVQPHTKTYIWKSTLKILPEYTSGSMGSDYRYVTFGVYPQSEKAADVTISEDAETQQHGSMKFIKGSDSCWYVKTGNSKYFKVEPIKWCVVTKQYNGSDRKLLLADKILVNCNYYEGALSDQIPEPVRSHQNTSNPAYPNSYWDSTVRAFLNGEDYYIRNFDLVNKDTLITKYKNQGFMYTAFNEVDLRKIADVKMDKVFLPSLEELKDYGITDAFRKRTATAFAKNNGTYTDESDYGKYWTRTTVTVPETNGKNEKDWVLIVTPDGVISNSDGTISENNIEKAAKWVNGSFKGTDSGIVPALIIE